MHWVRLATSGAARADNIRCKETRYLDCGHAGGCQRSDCDFSLWEAPGHEALRLFGIETGKAPCHATYHYFFQTLDADALSRTLGTFALDQGRAEHIAIDGKTLKGSRRLDDKAVHVLSAFATELGSVIGDLTVAPDQNEITAAVVLLKSLPLDGRIIAGDAIFTRRAGGALPARREICRYIRDANGHYLFTVKDNHPGLKAGIAEAFGDLSPLRPPA